MTISTYPHKNLLLRQEDPLKHRQRTSIQHWQLRDLLTFVNNDPRQLVSVNQSQLNTFNPLTGRSKPFMRELSFQPTCITTGCGYLAVGGQRSQVIVKSLISEWTASTIIGGAINNCIHISSAGAHGASYGVNGNSDSDNGGNYDYNNNIITNYNNNNNRNIKLLACNNDETIKVFDLPSMEHSGTIRLSYAVNGVSISPDGSKMIAVGDSSQVSLFNIEPNSSAYQQVGTLQTTKDAGFSCCWDQTGTKFAIGCQDGYVCVWDIRSSKKLAQIPSSQQGTGNGGRGAVRSVRFSQSGSIDLLAFSEHCSMFNVVDCRNFDEVDTVRVGLSPSLPASSPSSSTTTSTSTSDTYNYTENNITGLTFSPDNRSIFVGTEGCIWEYGIDTLKRRGFAQGNIL